MIVLSHAISPFVSCAACGLTFVAVALEMTPRLVLCSWHAPTNQGGSDHEMQELIGELERDLQQLGAERGATQIIIGVDLNCQVSPLTGCAGPFVESGQMRNYKESLPDPDQERKRAEEESSSSKNASTVRTAKRGGGFATPGRRPRALRIPDQLEGQKDRLRWGEEVTKFYEQFFQNQTSGERDLFFRLTIAIGKFARRSKTRDCLR